MTCQWLSGLTRGIKLVQRFLKYFRLFYVQRGAATQTPEGYRKQNKSAEIAGGRQLHEQHLDAYLIDTNTQTPLPSEFLCSSFPRSVAIKVLHLPHKLSGMPRNSSHASQQRANYLHGSGARRDTRGSGKVTKEVRSERWEVSSTGVKDSLFWGCRGGDGARSNEAMTIGGYRPESISINSFIIGQQLGPELVTATAFWPRLWRNCFHIKYKFICIFIWS